MNAPVDTGASVVAPHEKLPRRIAERLKVALTGGLYIDEFDYYGREYCTIPSAMMHIASAQLRAIRIALAHADNGIDESGGERSWCGSDQFNKSDAIAAIGGVMALLQEAHHITQDIREALDRSEPDEGGAP